MKKFYIPVLSFAFIIMAFNTYGQNPGSVQTLNGNVWDGCVIIPKPFTEHVFIPRDKSVAYNMDNRIAPCSSFIVTYNGFSPEAQAAFQYAVDIWSNLIDSDITIRVNANYVAAAAGNLGSASPANFLIEEPEFLADTAYAIALGESIIGQDSDGPAGTSIDINCNFNSNRTDWYFGTDGNTPAGEFDFVTVVLHELGHGLGILGFGRVDDNDNPTTGLLRNSGYVHIWDQFIDGTDIFLNPTPITGFPDPSSQLLNQFTNNELTCSSPNATAQNGGVTPEMYSPSTWNAGSSYSHWDEAAYPNSNPNALMTPFLSSGVAIHDPGPMTLGFMQDMGWSICPGALSTSEFTVEDFKLSPNPFIDKLSISVSNSTLANDVFDIDIIDINGRLVLSSENNLENGSLEINGLESLNPALYFLKITSQNSGNSVTKKVIKN